MQQEEERQRRNIHKSRPYFEEKQLCLEQLQTQKDRILELEIKIKSAKASYAMSLKNLEKISEEIHRIRGTDLSIVPPGPREPGVGATDDDDFEDPDSNNSSGKIGDNNSKIKMKNLNKMPIADIINQMEHDNAMETTSLDTNSIFSEDKDDEDYMQSIHDSKRDNSICDGGLSSFDTGNLTTNSRNEPIDNFDNHELNLEELRQKVKVLAVRPVEGSDGQTKDCWENELTATVDKLDRLMLLQETTSNAHNNSSTIKLIGGLADKPPKPIKNHNSLSNHHNHVFHTPQHSASMKYSGNMDNATTNATNSQSTSTTKTFLNSSLQAMQQKMEDLLPSQASSSSVMKELPLLSRISNEISANTANTVKVLKRRLSLN